MLVKSVEIRQLRRFSTSFNVDFKALNLRKNKSEATKKHSKRTALNVAKSRTEKMKFDQDWGSVWPGPRTFQPHTVPLPIRQGYVRKNATIPDKYANAELMKIPNFLHLTPPVVERQCAVLKKFCTPFPENLINHDELITEYFPLQIIHSDYCYSSPSIREPKSRIVTFKVKLDSLKLDEHARDKFLRLSNEKYSSETDYFTLVVDRCPTRQQNMEYALYMLTALVYESKKHESWESLKSESDMEYYDWDRNVSKKNLIEILSWRNSEPINLEKISDVVEPYKKSVCDIFNYGESEARIHTYKQAVKKLLNFK